MEKFTKVRNIRAIQDGVTLCALISYFHPEIYDFSTIIKENKAQNNKNAFTILSNNLSIPVLFDFSDFIDSKTSERALIFFMGFCIQYLLDEQFKDQNSCSEVDNDLHQMKNKIQLLERKMDNLASNSQRLSRGFELVLSSTSVETTIQHQKSINIDEMEMQNHVIELELRIGNLMSIIHSQKATLSELNEKQKKIDNILNDPPPIENLDNLHVRKLYSQLQQQNETLRESNASLEEKNNFLISNPTTFDTQESKYVHPPLSSSSRTRSASNVNVIRSGRKRVDTIMKTGSSTIQGFLSQTLSIDKAKRKNNEIDDNDLSNEEIILEDINTISEENKSDTSNSSSEKSASVVELLNSNFSQSDSSLLDHLEKISNKDDTNALSRKVSTEVHAVNERPSASTIVENRLQEIVKDDPDKIKRLESSDTWDLLDSMLSEYGIED